MQKKEKKIDFRTHSLENSAARHLRSERVLDPPFAQWSLVN